MRYFLSQLLGKRNATIRERFLRRRCRKSPVNTRGAFDRLNMHGLFDLFFGETRFRIFFHDRAPGALWPANHRCADFLFAHNRYHNFDANARRTSMSPRKQSSNSFRSSGVEKLCRDFSRQSTFRMPMIFVPTIRFSISY